VKKSDLRYRIDTLLKIASRTYDDVLREECCVEAKNLLDDTLEEATDSVDMFIAKYCTVGKGRTSRTAIYEAYNQKRINEGYPYYSRTALYARLRENGVTEIRTGGGRYFAMEVN